MRWLVLALVACSATPEPAEPAIAGAEGDDPVELVVDKPALRPILAQAMHVVASMRSTKYAHRSVIDVAAGHYELDCSGFVGYVLAESQPAALAELRAVANKRPLAKHFVTLMQQPPAGSVWQRIARVDELVPGDIVAWTKPADVVSKNTGHVMIVREPPRRDERHPDVWAVPIVDSTAVPHGAGDSRKASGATGLGTGEVLLIVDEANAPIGYRWSRGTKAKLHLTTIVLSRVTR